MTLPARLRQAWAFASLLVLHWRRSGMAGARVERFRKGSAFVIRLAAVALYASVGKTMGEASLRNAAAGAAQVEWLVASLVGFAVCWGMLTRGLALRGMTMPLASPLIDTLPTYDGSRTAVELFEVALAHVVMVAAFVNAAPVLSGIAAIGLGVATSLTAALVGAVSMRWIFVLAPAERAVSAGQLSIIGQAVFIGLALISQDARWSFHPSFFSPLARPIAGEGGLGPAFAFLGVVFVVASVALVAAERIGYDRIEVVPNRRFARATAEDLSIGGVDELLARREPGGRRWPMVVISALVVGSLGALLVFEEGSVSTAALAYMPQFFVGWTAWMSLPMAATIANRAVTRDLLARPFLAALPIEPRQLLDGKVAVVRKRILIGLIPLAFALLAPLPRDVWGEVAWRSAAVVVGAWIYGSAAVSVAFLVGGAQSARPQPGGTIRLESLLLLVPLTALFVAKSPWATLVPLAALSLVAVAAKRAATRVVRWLDDGEDFERETPEWRAALAFAAFEGSQALTARLVSSWTEDLGIVMGASYAVSAVVLIGLTAYGRRDLGPLRIMPRNPVAFGVALVGGMGTATLARIVARKFLDPEAGGPTLHFGQPGGIAFVVMAGVLAPVTEELFFRGWLQHVAERDLEPRRKWLAPFIAALAFASVHPPASFPAVFSLGLLAGFLYARTSSLGPSIVAHSAHNWVAVLFR